MPISPSGPFILKPSLICNSSSNFIKALVFVSLTTLPILTPTLLGCLPFITSLLLTLFKNPKVYSRLNTFFNLSKIS